MMEGRCGQLAGSGAAACWTLPCRAAEAAGKRCLMAVPSPPAAPPTTPTPHIHAPVRTAPRVPGH